MRSRMTTWSSAALLLALSVSVAAPASAQLGKLKKIAGDAVKDAAKEKAGIKDPESAQKGGGAKVDYTVTEERASAVLAVLSPYVETAKRELAEKEAEAAVAKVKADHEAKVKAVSDCVSKAAASAGMPDMGWMQTPKGAALQSKMQSVSARAAKVQQSGNQRAMLALSDTSAVLMTQQAALMFPKANCGTMPYAPKALLDFQAASMERSMQAASGASMPSGDDAIDVPASQRAGMTSGQFGRVREAIAIWVLQQSGDLPPTAYKFSDAEKAVLAAKAAQFKDWAPLFKANTLQWASWNDIKSW
jgi:hypothetical protein